jgi:endonuclease-3 related protein
MIKIYNKLLKNYGYQRWWPLYSLKTKNFEYNSRNPDTKSQKLEICLGAILTQGTNWKNVEKALLNLIKNNLINEENLIKISLKKLSLLIKSSGYHNQKAIKIKEFIKFLNSKTKITKENLLNIWGIGKETADSILLYTYNKPHFVVDNYTRRIFSRLNSYDKNIKYEELQKLITNKIPNNINLYKEFHALIVEHGKNICMKKPLCDKCVLNNICKFNQS